MFGNLFPNHVQRAGIGFNLGFEYRHSRSKNIPDPTQAAGDQLGFNAADPFSYHHEVNSWFGEVAVPDHHLDDERSRVRSLELQVAYRYEKFDNKDQFAQPDPLDPALSLGKRESSFNNNGDMRISLRYQPVDWITLRASFGESFLSPSPGQLFAPTAENFPQLFDPFTDQTLQPREGVIQGGNTALRAGNDRDLHGRYRGDAEVPARLHLYG